MPPTFNSSDKSPEISFLGMGIMGSAMAFNLLKAGHRLKVWNRSQSRAVLAELERAGALVETQLDSCVESADIVFTCLGDEKDVISRLTGPGDSLLAHGKKGALVVDFSTIGPEAARLVEGELARAGVRFLDAPVTGGDVGARNATLTIMVGGAEDDFKEALPLLSFLGKNIRYCGPSGAGQALKLCNQILCAVNMVSVCEALSLAQSLDLDRELVVDVLASGAGGSWALANLGRRIFQDDLKPAFSLRNMLKDLRLVFDCLPVGEKSGGSDSDGIAAASLAEGLGAADGTRERLPGSALAEALFLTVAGEGDEAPDAFGTQAMIRAYGRGGVRTFPLAKVADSR